MEVQSSKHNEPKENEGPEHRHGKGSCSAVAVGLKNIANFVPLNVRVAVEPDQSDSGRRSIGREEQSHHY